MILFSKAKQELVVEFRSSEHKHYSERTRFRNSWVFFCERGGASIAAAVQPSLAFRSVEPWVERCIFESPGSTLNSAFPFVVMLVAGFFLEVSQDLTDRSDFAAQLAHYFVSLSLSCCVFTLYFMFRYM